MSSTGWRSAKDLPHDRRAADRPSCLDRRIQRATAAQGVGASDPRDRVDSTAAFLRVLGLYSYVRIFKWQAREFVAPFGNVQPAAGGTRRAKARYLVELAIDAHLVQPPRGGDEIAVVLLALTQRMPAARTRRYRASTSVTRGPALEGTLAAQTDRVVVVGQRLDTLILAGEPKSSLYSSCIRLHCYLSRAGDQLAVEQVLECLRYEVRADICAVFLLISPASGKGASSPIAPTMGMSFSAQARTAGRWGSTKAAVDFAGPGPRLLSD